MGFFKRVAGFLGFAHNETKEGEEEEEYEEEVNADPDSADVDTRHRHLPRKGFSVSVPVSVDRAQPGPVLIPCRVGAGGIQGLRWYAKRLRVDEDGDVADEFLSETFASHSETSSEQNERFPRFEIKYNAAPAKVRNQVLGPNGRVHQSIEYKGKLQWV